MLYTSLQSLKNDIANSFSKPIHPGILNYLITELLLHKIDLETADNELPRYAQLNEIIGILECCKLEIYRRLGKLIEEKAIHINGDLDSCSVIFSTNKK